MLAKIFLLKNLNSKIGKTLNILGGTYNKNNIIFKNPIKFYHPVRELMKKKTTKYFSDPNDIGEEIIRIISLHDKITDPTKVTMASTFEEIGLDSIDFVECLLQIEYEIGYDFGSADWEQFVTINDIAQFLAKDYYAQKH